MSDRKKSKYATKKERGNMMYGPGCCAHGISQAQMDRTRENARLSGHKFWTPAWSDRRKSF